MRRLAIALALLLALPGIAHAAGLAFEDRNNNGIFDGDDLDFTAELIASDFGSTWVTPHSVVLRGKLKSLPCKPALCLDPRGSSNGFSIISGGNITIDADLDGGGFGSTCRFQGTDITVTSGVSIKCQNHISFGANKRLTIGDNVSFKAVGDVAMVSELSNIVVGEKFQASVSEQGIYATALAGRIDFGDKANLQCKNGTLALTARNSLTLNQAKLKGDGGVFLFTATGGIEFMGGSISGEFIALNGMGSGVNVTGSKFSSPPDITP